MAALTSISLKVKGYINFLGGFGKFLIDTPPFEDASSNPYVISVELANGNNTISFPSGMNGCLIQLDPASTRTKILKGAAGDTGIQISTTGLGGNLIIPLATAATSFVINCSGADTGIQTKFHFF